MHEMRQLDLERWWIFAFFLFPPLGVFSLMGFLEGRGRGGLDGRMIESMNRGGAEVTNDRWT